MNKYLIIKKNFNINKNIYIIKKILMKKKKKIIIIYLIYILCIKS